MDLLSERLDSARRALEALNQILQRDRADQVVRDATIQRFEFTFEAIWHAAKRFLREIEGVATASPKACVRASREAGLLGDDEAVLALRMVDQRNQTVHTYDEKVAMEVAAAVANYAPVLDAWLGAMERRVA